MKPTPTDIIKILNQAKTQLINDHLRIDPMYFGLCHHISSNIKDVLNIPICQLNDIINYIPEFNRETLVPEGKFGIFYWWPQRNLNSRIQALDTLINIYKSKTHSQL